MKTISAAILGFMMIYTVGGCDHRSYIENKASLDELNRVVATLTMVKGYCPTNISDLTNFPSLRGKILPKSPAGEKLAIDSSTHRVIFVTQ